MKKFNLEDWDKKDLFEVPKQYFEDLSERIHQRILSNSLEDNLIENFNKKDPFEVPKQYFEDFSEKLNQRILSDSLEDNLLENFDKKMPFEVPKQYFEDFSEKLNQRIKQENSKENQQKNKIYTPKPLHTNTNTDTSIYIRFQTKFHTYTKMFAIAAALVLLGGFAYVIYDNNQQKIENLTSQNNQNTAYLLAFSAVPKEISNNEIVEYFKENHTENNVNEVLEDITEAHITETHLEEFVEKQEKTERIPTEIPTEVLTESKSIIINDLPKEELKKEVQEMLNTGELEDEILD